MMGSLDRFFVNPPLVLSATSFEAVCAVCGDVFECPPGEDPEDTLCVGCADDRDSGDEGEEPS